jgi:hypothetical protein
MDDNKLFEGSQRQRSPRRLRHEAETKVFQDQAGSLEAIRNKLGLRPSQICEILKVHPSAWTRWSKANKAPPHVYQMLEWYMELLQWRGQQFPLKPLSSLRREDLATYVPKIDSSQRSSIVNGSKGTRQIKILIIIWCIQIFLWCIVMFVLLRQHR